jgi:hypothetical protein
MFNFIGPGRTPLLLTKLSSLGVTVNTYAACARTAQPQPKTDNTVITRQGEKKEWQTQRDKVCVSVIGHLYTQKTVVAVRLPFHTPTASDTLPASGFQSYRGY